MATGKTSTKKSQKISPAPKVSKKQTSSVRKSSLKSSPRLTHAVDVFPIASTDTPRRIVIRKPFVIAIVAALIVIGILYYIRGFFVAAIVNGQPVSRWAVVHSLEQQGGKQALDSIITDTVIKQEAAKQNITVKQSDIDSQIKTIETNLSKQGETLDSALQAQGMTRQDLNDRMRIQLLVQKMVKPVSVTDAQAKDYMDKNKDNLPPGSTLASVKQQLQQQDLQNEEQTYVNGLRSKAKIAYWVNY